MNIDDRGYGPLTGVDLRYIRASFVTLSDACLGRCTLEEARAHVRGRRWPAASYVLDDGTEMVPPDYFALLDEAGTPHRLARSFADRYARAMHASGLARDERRITEEWNAYLDGEYGVCLRSVTPEAIFTKESLVRSAEALLARPAPEDPAWRRRIADEVSRLDALLREFAPCDRPRFGGSVSRDRVVTAARAAYPELFAERP